MKIAPHRRVDEIPGFAVWSRIFYAFLYLPIFILIAFSFNEGRSATVWTHFSLRWYAKAFDNESIQQAAINSAIVAVCATAAATSLALAAALGFSRGRKFRGRASAEAALLLPLMIPEIVTAVATLSFFVAIGLALGLGNVIIAHTVFCLPFAYLPIRARLAGMDDALESAARDLYAGPWRCFIYITLPLLAPGIAAGAMLAFIISLDDFVITLMVADAGSTTLPVYIYSLVRIGTSPEINAVSTVLLAASCALILAYHFISKR